MKPKKRTLALGKSHAKQSASPARDPSLVKERLYVRDDTYAWLPAVLLERGGVDEERRGRDKVRIDLPPDWLETTLAPKGDFYTLHQKKKWIPRDDAVPASFWPGNPASNAGTTLVRDLSTLEPLNEASVLHALKQRLARGLYYTRMGDVLLAVNPITDRPPQHFSTELRRTYAKSFVWQVDESSDASLDSSAHDHGGTASTFAMTSPHSQAYERLDLEPHLYEISATAYRRLVLQDTPQSILVGGISGSGKSETVHRLLEHLVTMDAWSTDDVAATAARGKIHQAMLDHVLDSWKLLRAFGCAATPLQPNSTRCGTVLKLHFALHKHGLYGLVGCKTQLLLLEASRVVDREPGGNSFHIFYHLLALPEDTKSRLLGPEWSDATPRDFAYLQYTSKSPEEMDADGAVQLLNVLEGFQCNSLHLPHLIQALGIVLLLGNLKFEPNEVGAALVAEGSDLEQLSVLMGVESSVIASYLTTATNSVNHEPFSTRLDPSAARAGRDALAITIYQCIVDSVFRAINTHTASALQDDHRYGEVSLVDVFGLEQMQLNRFEQLVVNVTAETLHRKIRLEHWCSLIAEYEKEGIDILSHIPSDALDPLVASDGIHGCIDELLNKTVADRCKTQATVEDADSKISLCTVDSPCKFSIKHFLGPVEYDMSNWPHHNGVVPGNLLQLAAKSSNSVIAAEFCDLVSSSGLASTPSKTFHSVLRDVRVSVGSLLETSKRSQVQLIWCIKPSDIKDSCVVDQQSTRLQLQGADLSTAVAFEAVRFSSNLLFHEVIGRFTCLLSTKQKLAVSRMEPCDRVHFVLSTLLARMVKELPSSSVHFVCGAHKVYFQGGVLQALEQRRRSLLESKALVIQRFVRRTEAMSHHRRQHLGVVLIQSKFRSYQAASFYRQRRESATIIQALVRGFRERKRFYRMVKARSTINAAVMRYIKWCRRTKKDRSATAIAAWYLSRQATARYVEQRGSATKIQASARKWMTQRSCRQKIRAFAVLTRFFKSILTAISQIRRERAATLLSRWYRSNSARLKYMITIQAVVTIQARTRSFSASSVYRKKVRSALLIARFYAQLRMKWQQQLEETASDMITAWYRSVMAKRAYYQQLRRIKSFQALVRGAKSRAVWNTRLRAAKRIARFCTAVWIARCCLHQRVDLSRKCDAATRIAAWYKSRRCSLQFQGTIHSTIVAQSAMRRYTAKRKLKSLQDLRRMCELESASVTMIAAWYRCIKQLRAYRYFRNAVVTLQAAWRATRIRDEFLIMKGATLYLESWIQRCVMPQIQWNKENAVIILQAWTRGWQAQERYTRSQRAALLLQTAFRQWRRMIQDACVATQIDRTSWVEYSSGDGVSQRSVHGSSQGLIAERLQREIEEYKYNNAILKSEVQQVTQFATLHAQEIETEYEEKLAVYEEEVLSLKQEIARCMQENMEMKSALQDAQRGYEKNIRIMQRGIQKTQASHRDYLDKIMVLLDDTELARKTETDRIREELDTMKRERDAKIAALKEEVHLLRSIGISPKVTSQRLQPGSLTQGARKLAQKLKAALMPEHILAVAREALEHPGAANRYVEAKLSSQALKNISYLEEIIQIAEFEASKQAELTREAKQQLGEVEVQLTRAYLDNGQFQTKARRRKDFLE